MAWYGSNSGSRTHEVGQKAPNAWGLYDMLGNVLEWCDDWYGAYDSAHANDPIGAAEGTFRVGRGGSWAYSAVPVRAADRLNNEPAFRNDLIGFRVVRGP